MASKHRGIGSLASGIGGASPRRRIDRWRRRLGFEPLEDRCLLTTFIVNTTNDENNGLGGNVSLREAVGAANAGDIIQFSIVGTIQLQENIGAGHIVIDESITIQGPGASLLTVQAADDGANDGDGRRVFYIKGSGTLNVSISGLTLTNGDPDLANVEGSVGGGAIHNEENLSLIGCVLTGNFAPSGGAILSISGALNITDCVISGNAAQDGGGIEIYQNGSLTLTRTTITNNTASNAGGGVLSFTRPVTVNDSTISGNMAIEHGGGLYQYQSSLTITGSTISGNVADSNHDDLGSGGGIFNKSGSLNITSTTISGNSAQDGGGGGVFSDTNPTITIAHSTITNNFVTGSGSGGGGVNVSSGDADLNHTIIAGNLRNSSRSDVAGTFDALYSFIGDDGNENVDNVAGSIIGTPSLPKNAMLGPLAANGGRNMTHALLVSSQAIDAGNASGSGFPSFDQRGTPFVRIADGNGVAGARIDMGAYEKQAMLPGDYNLNGVVDSGDYVVWRNTLGTGVSEQYSGADGNGDWVVDVNDYVVWRTNFGNHLPAAVASEGNSRQTALAAAFASLARSKRVDSGTQVELLRDPQALALDSAIELLLAIDPEETGASAYSYDSAVGVSGSEAKDGAAFDTLPDEKRDATEVALNL